MEKAGSISNTKLKMSDPVLTPIWAIRIGSDFDLRRQIPASTAIWKILFRSWLPFECGGSGLDSKVTDYFGLK